MYSEGSPAVKANNETAFEYFKKAADKVTQNDNIIYYTDYNAYLCIDICNVSAFIYVDFRILYLYTNFYLLNRVILLDRVV